MTIALILALAAVLILAVTFRRYWDTWLQVAGLLLAVLLMIWLQDNGYLDGGRSGGAGVPSQAASPR